VVEERNATSDAAGSARSPRIDVKCVILAERGHQCVNGRNSDKTLIEPYLHWSTGYHTRRGGRRKPTRGSTINLWLESAAKLA